VAQMVPAVLTMLASSKGVKESFGEKVEVKSH